MNSSDVRKFFEDKGKFLDTLSDIVQRCMKEWKGQPGWNLRRYADVQFVENDNNLLSLTVEHVHLGSAFPIGINIEAFDDPDGYPKRFAEKLKMAEEEIRRKKEDREKEYRRAKYEELKKEFEGQGV